MQTPKTYHVRGTRPDNIPSDMVILNAPRPITGNIEWTGDFRHGRFYAALSPADFSALNDASELDAWQLVYHDDAEIKEWCKTRYGAKVNVDNYDADELAVSFFNAMNKEFKR